MLQWTVKLAIEKNQVHILLTDSIWLFISHILNQISSNIEDYPSRWLSNIIWILGKMGPEIKNKIINKKLLIKDFIKIILKISKSKIEQFKDRKSVV